MRITGIAAEYNPLHNGHIYHIEKARELTEADGIVAVMSGSFTQRGEPAVMDKWTRAKLAVINGIDLVFELPFLHAHQRRYSQQEASIYWSDQEPHICASEARTVISLF